jgi:hypothetical protein
MSSPSECEIDDDYTRDISTELIDEAADLSPLHCKSPLQGFEAVFADE